MEKKPMKKTWKYIAIIEAVILLIIAIVSIIRCTQKQERIHADDVVRIVIVDSYWARFKIIEEPEDINKVCEILNSIDAEKLDASNEVPSEKIPIGGPALRFVFERSTGPSIEYDYYEGIFLSHDGVKYLIDDTRLSDIWEAESGYREGSYRVEFDEK